MDSKKRLIITSVISIILVSILFIGSTYSIFTSTDVDQESNVYQTGNLSIQFENTNNVALEITKPMSDQKAVSLTPYHLTVTNNGTVAYKFNIVLNPTTATDEINHQYIMTKVGQLDSKKFSDCTNNIIKEGVILLPKTSVDIDVRVWLSDTVQNTEVNKSFSAKLSIDGVGAYSKHTEVDNSALASNDKLASRFSYDNSKSNFDCSDVQCAIDTLDKALGGSDLFLGAYVSMTPKKSSYTTDTSKTGYTSSQTINPQELNLWRVIKINSDGTVEMISEHVSSTDVYFRGKTGYLNLVGYLNVLASQYENSTYTKGSRHFGYNGQTEYITDTSKFTSSAPWTCGTGGSCNPVESQGGGDWLYTTDYNLVKATEVVTKPNSASGSSYWMASRDYSYSSSTSYGWYGHSVDASGANNLNHLYDYVGSSFSTSSNSKSLRPIVTLKSGLKYTGSGTADDPFKPSTK
ncbi:MAG: hypothetical protein PUD25_04655 [Bacilli bacterium]|nr:hypothetical protein [Bacilli bacterium]